MLHAGMGYAGDGTICKPFCGKNSRSAVDRDYQSNKA